MRSDLAVALLCGLSACTSATARTGDKDKGGAVVGTISGLHPDRYPVVVFLEGKRAEPEKPRLHRIGQKGLEFKPAFLVVSAGDTVAFPNDDDVSHNVFSVSRAKSFDLGLYNPGANKKVQFKKTGLIDLFCNIHENMHAIVVVVPSRFSAHVDGKGEYRIEGIAPGSYEAVMWKEGKELLRTPVVARSGKVVRVDFDVPR